MASSPPDPQASPLGLFRKPAQTPSSAKAKAAPEERPPDPGAVDVFLGRLLTQAEQEVILGSSVRVLTADFENCPLAERHRSVVALLEDGRVLVAKGHQLDPVVHDVRFRLAPQFVEGGCTGLYQVDEFTMSQLYESARDRAGDAGVRVSEERSAVIEYLSDLLRRSAAVNASDVHVAVSRGEGNIRLRVDGDLEDLEKVSAKKSQELLNVAYLLSELNEGGAFQPFRFLSTRMSGVKMPLPGGVQSLRLQFNPVDAGGTLLVARILYQVSSLGEGDVDTLGYSDDQVRAIRMLRLLPHGVNFVAGVTGSGKSTTLQRLLASLVKQRAGKVNLVTVEDPVEFLIPGSHQFSVPGSADDEERAKRFGAALRAALRSDPDVVMIGEIRDLVSARLAIDASMTGHLVWTTLHATTAVGSVERLLQVGLDEGRLLDAQVLTGLVGQRLVKRLCGGCALPWEEYESGLDLDTDQDRLLMLQQLTERFSGIGRGQLRFRNPGVGKEGCGEKGCRRGVQGRTVVAEVLRTSEAFFRAYREDPLRAEHELFSAQKAFSMAEHGLAKAFGGVVDPLDVQEAVGIDHVGSFRKDGDLSGYRARLRELLDRAMGDPGALG